MLRDYVPTLPFNSEENWGFLRSINLSYDAEVPERISHFFPTSKCVSLIRAILGEEQDRAFFAVAPYGSGKSLTAAFALHLIENHKDARPVLSQITDRLTRVDEALAKHAIHRIQKEKKGVALDFQGYAPSIPAALQEAVRKAMKRVKLGREARRLDNYKITTIEEAIDTLQWLQKKAWEKGYDRIAILWDEFGRHLDLLIAEGKETELEDLQTLAEFVTRSKRPAITLNLFLHQGLMHYASDMPQTVRKEWTKIEGRFRSIQYLDDSKEIYQLIAQIVSAQRPQELVPSLDYRDWAQRLLELGRFRGFEVEELAELIRNAYPLEPLTLELLPRVAGRVAQNERTLFGFLYQADLDSEVTPADLYDFFSESMRADTGVGGTYRQWLETESALAKIGEEEIPRKALKTTCLLGLGVSGERARANNSLLVSAVAGYKAGREEATQAIDHLIQQKLLLHRRHSDSVSVWHGTDADLRGKLEEEKQSKRAQFDLRAFLADELPPPVWRPVEYNDDYRIRRYFTGEYHTLETIAPYLESEVPADQLPIDIDGKVLYILAESSQELAEVNLRLQQRETNPRLVFALPSEPFSLTEAALEVWCLTHMQHDNELVGTDPLILPELRQMADDARGHLRRLAQRLLYPSSQGPQWYYRGNSINLENSKKLRKKLSSIMRDVYPDTPRINNELIVRKKPSQIIINARKKLVMGILERTSQSNLGMEGKTPDVSMYRTVIAQTGLYRFWEEQPRFAHPEELADLGLRKIWTEFRYFFAEPEDHPKKFSQLFYKLKSPPYGVRSGLIPIFLASAFKAFPSAISLLKDGVYVEDILPTEIESIFRQPERYQLQVLGVDESKINYLQGFYKVFTGEDLNPANQADDLIRTCFEAFQDWKTELPTAAFYSSKLSKEAKDFQKIIQSQQDPVRLLFSDIPRIFEVDQDNLQETLSELQKVKEELESVHIYLGKMAADSLRKTISPGKSYNGDLREVSQQWAQSFPQFVLNEIKDASVKALITQMSRSYKSEEILLNALSQGLLGKPLKRWDDSTISSFEREFERAARKAEDVALGVVDKVDLDSEGAQQLAHLLEDRVGTLVERLTHLLGPEKTRSFLLEQVPKKEPKDGQP